MSIIALAAGAHTRGGTAAVIVRLCRTFLYACRGQQQQRSEGAAAVVHTAAEPSQVSYWLVVSLPVCMLIGFSHGLAGGTCDVERDG